MGDTCRLILTLFGDYIDYYYAIVLGWHGSHGKADIVRAYNGNL